VWSVTLWAQSYPVGECGFGDIHHTASTAIDEPGMERSPGPELSAGARDNNTPNLGLNTINFNVIRGLERSNPDHRKGEFERKSTGTSRRFCELAMPGFCHIRDFPTGWEISLQEYC
jgi:hypothetical protein